MQILTREGKYESRSANPYAPWGSTAPPPPGSIGMAAGGVHISEHTALQLAAVWGSVSLIADSIATLPIRQYRQVGSSDAKQIECAAVIQRPWSEITQRDFVTQGTLSLLLRGDLWGRVIERGPKLYPEQVQLIHPDHARVRRNQTNGNVEVRYWNELIPTDDVTRAMALSVPEGLSGLNPIEYLRNSLALSRAQDLWGGSFFANSARPDGVIEVDDDLDDDETKRMMLGWNAAHQGINHAHLPAILTQGAKWQPVTMNMADVQFLEQMQFSESVISGRIYRIPPHMLGMVDKDTSWGCLPGDALVFTTRGPKPIEDVRPGDDVWSMHDDGMRPATVTGHVMNGYKPLLTVETHERTLRCTENHHIPVRRYFGIKDGRRFGECGWKTILIDAKHVRVGDYLLVPSGLRPGGSRTAPDGRELTVEMMELCGFYLGNGNRDGGNRIELAHHVDSASWMGRYRDTVAREFGVHAYTAPHGHGRGGRTRFSSPEAVELLKHGFTGTALTKRVPSWVFELDDGLQFGLLRGYLDADGTVNKSGVIVFSSANRGLLEDVRHLCIRLGVPVGRVVHARPGGQHKIQGRSCVSQAKYHLSLSSRPFNSRIGSNNPAKAARFNDTAHARRCRYDDGWLDGSNRRPQDRRQQPGWQWPHKDIKLARVRNVTRSTVAVPVFDIEVKGPANFVADGTIVGNSGIEQQELGFVRNTLLIWLCRWEDLMTSWLPPGQFVTFDLSQRLRGDTLQRWSAYQIARVIGAMNNAEIRKAEGLPTVTDPDQLGVLEDFAAPLNSAPVKPTSTGGAGGDKAN